MIGPTALALPGPANDNADPFGKIGTALLELHRLRRQMLAKDKRGFSADQWHRYHEALKGLDHAIERCLPYL